MMRMTSSTPRRLAPATYNNARISVSAPKTVRRVGFVPSLGRQQAIGIGERLYDHFADQVRRHGVTMATGIFGAEMR